MDLSNLNETACYTILIHHINNILGADLSYKSQTVITNARDGWIKDRFIISKAIALLK